ncbi:MAG TPA: hypothetical protein QGF58_27305 [Myxococcota bacterium]|nr:hypothetical protein [Myxococcota bacterium]
MSSPERPPRIEALVWLALALAATALMSWPLASQVGTHSLVGLHNPDVITSIWWYDRVADSVATLSNPFWAEDLLWPMGAQIGASIWNLGAPLAAVPLTWAVGPVGALSAAAIVFTALTGVIAGVATRRLGGDRVSAALAVLVGASLCFGVVECASGRGEQALLAPILAFLVGYARLRERPGSRGLAVATGVALGLSGAVYWMGAYMLLVVLGLDVLARAARRRLDRAALVDLLIVGVASFLVALPFLAPVVIGSVQGSDHGLLNAQEAGGIDGAMALPWALEGPFAPSHRDASRRWPLLALPVLALGAWRLRGPARFLAGVGLVAAVFSLGRYLWLPWMVGGEPVAVPMPHRALDLLPGFSRFWWPYRWSMLLLPCFAVVAGALAATRRPLWQRGLALALVAPWSIYEGAAMLRLSPALPPVPTEAVEVPEVFRRLGAEPGQHPMLQLPARNVKAGMLHWQVWHQQPIDTAVGWQLPGAIPGAWDDNVAQSELLSALISDPGQAARRDWSAEDAGGFHYVVLFSGQPPKPGERPIGFEERRSWISELLGQPAYNDGNLALWLMPGAPPLPR